MSPDAVDPQYLLILREAILRRALLRAFEKDRDAKPCVIAAPGRGTWRSDWIMVIFPEQERIYL